MASLIGDRFSLIEPTDTMARIVRRYVDSYGLGHKLVSVRSVGRSSTELAGYIRRYEKDERAKQLEVKKVLDEIQVQCESAIEEDRADCLILGCPPLQCLEDDIRQRLDASGYDEIQLISEIPATVEMAKAMVNMKLIQAPRAYPSDGLKAKPKFR